MAKGEFRRSIAFIVLAMAPGWQSGRTWLGQT